MPFTAQIRVVTYNVDVHPLGIHHCLRDWRCVEKEEMLQLMPKDLVSFPESNGDIAKMHPPPQLTVYRMHAYCQMQNAILCQPFSSEFRTKS